VSLPGAHAIAILSTELHVELDRIRFGDDNIGPVAVDDTGKRAVTTTGNIPFAGLPDPQGGAVYAFDPSRLATEQDRNRASMLGNPVSALMSPDGVTTYVVLRAKNRIVGLEWQESGALRQREPVEVCDQPEEIVLVRKGRRALVRCNRGRALEVVDLEKGAVERHISLSAAATDLVVSPDSEQAIVALQGLKDGAVALVDLETFDVEHVPLTEPPSRVRLSADGRTVLAISDRSKVAWVIR
jgi:DNA-binding beta-propeller fold protein YncE